MTKEELINKLKAIADNFEYEGSDHVTADDLLLEYINDKSVEETFHSIKKWYE